MPNLVKMYRLEPSKPNGPLTADVHPDEVENYASYGWLVDQQESIPALAESPAVEDELPPAPEPELQPEPEESPVFVQIMAAVSIEELRDVAKDHDLKLHHAVRRVETARAALIDQLIADD